MSDKSLENFLLAGETEEEIIDYEINGEHHQYEVKGEPNDDWAAEPEQ